MRVDLGHARRGHLPEENVAEGAGVPDALDRNAVRPEQVINRRPLLVGAFQLDLDFEPVGFGKEPEGLGDHHAAFGLGAEDDRLPGKRGIGLEVLARDRSDDLAIFADDFPQLGIEKVRGFIRGSTKSRLVGIVGAVEIMGEYPCRLAGPGSSSRPSRAGPWCRD